MYTIDTIRQVKNDLAQNRKKIEMNITRLIGAADTFTALASAVETANAMPETYDLMVWDVARSVKGLAEIMRTQADCLAEYAAAVKRLDDALAETNLLLGQK